MTILLIIEDFIVGFALCSALSAMRGFGDGLLGKRDSKLDG
jgi:hypothetical protein